LDIHGILDGSIEKLCSIFLHICAWRIFRFYISKKTFLKLSLHLSSMKGCMKRKNASTIGRKLQQIIDHRNEKHMPSGGYEMNFIKLVV
jgi:hypothetical protein